MAFYSPDPPIQASDNIAAKLTLDQCRVIISWCGWQTCSTFEDSNGQQWPLQAILDAFHASCNYGTFDGWQEVSPKPARRAYDAIRRRHKIT